MGSKHIAKLQYITQDLPGISHAELVRTIGLAGVKWVQLRLKDRAFNSCKSIAHTVKEVCRSIGATLIINDHPRLAKEVQADGVHLGQNDMGILQARKILGENSIIGGTANTLEDMVKLTEEGADYIGLGPFKMTDTKKNLSPLLGIDGIQNIMNEYAMVRDPIPVIGVGGILPEDVPELLEIGIHGVAVASAINEHKNKQEAVKQFKDGISLAPSH